MNPQRLAKPAILWGKRSLIPFPTLVPSFNEYPARVSARMLFPQTCDAQHYQLFQRWTKASPVLNLKSIAPMFEGPANMVSCDAAGSYMYVNFGDVSTAVLFSDGSLVTWFMPKDEELKLAASLLTVHNSESIQLDDSNTESIDVGSESVDGVSCLMGGESILLTPNDERRSDEILAISMAFSSAVRMNALEHSLSLYIENGHSDLFKLLKRINNWKLSSISESIFTSEKGVHNWRYYLNNVHQNSVPDILWEHESLDKIYDSVSNNFDTNKRFIELQSSLTHYHEYLLTVGEYVRHRYSSRLEKTIILIIAIEAILAFRHAVVDITH